MKKTKAAAPRQLPMGRATRDAYGEALRDLGKENPDIIVLDADLSKSTKAAVFGEAFPDRFFNVGIAEANMAGIASGLAACGKIPFISSFASFLACKTYDQARMGAAYSDLPVKFIGTHGGITLGEDGVSQMSIEDLGLMMTLPGFTVVVPADEVSTKPLTRQLASTGKPGYMRLTRNKTPRVYEDEKVTLGKGRILAEGKDVAIVACGIMVAEALVAADLLATDGISATVVDMHTLKPLDEDLLAKVAKQCGAVVTAEEHQVWCGLGSVVAAALGRHCPVPMELVAIADTYAESGTGPELQKKYGLTSTEIVKAAKKALERK